MKLRVATIFALVHQLQVGQMVTQDRLDCRPLCLNSKRCFATLIGKLFLAIGVTVSVTTHCLAGDMPRRLETTGVVRENPRPHYYWKTAPVSGGAQIVTLFCRDCGNSASGPADVPLVAVLRDTLGDNLAETDRLRYVWLLSYSRPTVWQRALSAVPFFYWRVGRGSGDEKPSRTAPLIDISAPRTPVVIDVARSLMQWTLLDPMTTPVRASTRAYRTNEMDHERLHLEEAISYLREAPVDSETSLTSGELDTVLARLELRKRLLGGLASERSARKFGQQDAFEQERIRSRNWEMLRQSAEKTGLIFESLDVAGSKGQYGVLWYPAGQRFDAPAVGLGPIWKLLNISNPWTDDRLQAWEGPAFERALDENGTLLPAGEHGAQFVQLIPLGIYNLNYPKLPLLLVDFRDTLHIRRREMTQRAINEITSGVLGLSHFTNWYYFAGSAAYEFIVNRHGASLDRAARLDCYSQFRVALALDHSLDPDFRKEAQTRVNALAVNPLEASPEDELQLAAYRYERLMSDSSDQSWLKSRLSKDRRAELAEFGQSDSQELTNGLLHAASLGLYTKRAKDTPSTIDALERQRRILYNLRFLDTLAAANTQPEIAVNSDRIQESIHQLVLLAPDVSSPDLRTQIVSTIQKVRELSHDPVLQANCLQAAESLEIGVQTKVKSVKTGILADSRARLGKSVRLPGALQ